MRSQRLSWSLGAVTACLATAALSGCDNSDAAGGDSGGGGASTGGSTASGGTGGSSGGTTGGGSGAVGTGGASGVAGTGVGGTGGSAAGAGGTVDTGGAAGSGAAAGSGGTIAGDGGTGRGGTRAIGGAAGSIAGMGGMGGSSGSGGAGNGGAGGKANNCPAAMPRTGGTQYCSNSKGNAGNGYAYELWAEGTGTGCMTVFGANATFKASWTNVEDFLARVGLDFDRTRTHTQIGTITAEFAETKTGDTGLTYIGIYGWTVNPLREYYILDDWGSTKPAGFASDGTPRTSVGTLTADGETYDVWKHTRVNKPAITGDNMTFDQYFSIRQTARQCGRISISQHFSEWTALGLQLGQLVEAKLLVEAQDNSGTIEFSTATIEVD